MNKRCPRARYNGSQQRKFLVAKDPAVEIIARMVVAGVDKKYELHPKYDVWVAEYGREKAEQLIAETVSLPGACDIIQTEMDLGGLGLFGGLAEDKSQFVFYDWADPPAQMMTSMTAQEARDIVAGKKKTIVFWFAEQQHS